MKRNRLRRGCSLSSATSVVVVDGNIIDFLFDMTSFYIVRECVLFCVSRAT